MTQGTPLAADEISTTMPPSSTDLLRRHIRSTDAWKVFKGPSGWSYTPVVLVGGTYTPGARVRHTDAQMAAIDERLPDVMRALMDADSLVEGWNVRATLELWGGELVELPLGMLPGLDAACYTRESSVLVRVLPGAPKNTDPVLWLMYPRYGVAKTGDGSVYVETCTHPSCALELSWLNRERPSWRDTVALVGALNISNDQFAQMLLFAPADNLSNHQELPGLDIT